jgi:hypothetical protein
LLGLWLCDHESQTLPGLTASSTNDGPFGNSERALKRRALRHPERAHRSSPMTRQEALELNELPGPL